MTILKKMAEHFHQGEWPMWPILGVLVLVVAILIERTIYLRRAGIDKRRLLSLLRAQIMAGNIQGAIKVCTGNPTPLTEIVKAGLLRYNRPDAEVQAAMDEAALCELPRLEERTGYLAALGNVATLIGLLGTIVGLIDSFASVSGVDPAMKAALLAKGIAEAMNCTAFGLITAIPALLGYAALNGKIQHMLDDIQQVSVQVLNLVVSHRKLMNASPTAQV